MSTPTPSLRPQSTPATTSSSGSFNLKEWLEFEVDILGFFSISRLIICLIALVLACCCLCCILFCIRHHFLKAKRKKNEYFEGRKKRADDKQAEKDLKKRTMEAWTETIDVNSKSTCYHNSITNETTWEKPKGYRKKKIGAKAILEMSNPMSKGSELRNGGTNTNHARTETKLPSNWESEFSPEGYKFYHNGETGEVTWTGKYYIKILYLPKSERERVLTRNYVVFCDILIIFDFLKTPANHFINVIYHTS